MPKKDEESKLKKVKEDYKKVSEKHKLPSFEELNEDFHVEKVSETETDFLLREIRKIISERIFNYLRTVETLINPSNAPMFVFSVVKTLSSEDKSKLTEIYKELARNEIRLFAIDVEYSEKKEADFIRDVFKTWQKIKKDLVKILGTIEKNIDSKSDNNHRKYFG